MVFISYKPFSLKAIEIFDRTVGKPPIEIYYPPEVSSMKYCKLEVFWKEYFMLCTSGNKTDRKSPLKYLKIARGSGILAMNTRYI